MERAQLVVVGSGPAGTAAAIEAADAGVEVTLTDENPIDFSMMGLDIPYYFGQRMMPSLRDKGLTLQRVVSSNQLLETAREKGVQVLPGTYVWGSFRNQENSRQIEKPILGLADEDRSWLLEYDRLILAPGAGDLVMGFTGRDLVGVVGANAVNALLSLYQGLTTKKMVVLGSGDLGLSTAIQAMDHGIEVTAVVDISPSVRGSQDFQARLDSQNVPFYTSHTVKEARGHREVESIVIVSIDDQFQPILGTERAIGCDTICLAIGLVPNVELPYLTGCRLTYRHDLGGFVPDTDQGMQTSVEGIYVAGDGNGFRETMVTNPDVAKAEGRLAAIAAAKSLGALDSAKANSLRGDVGPAQGSTKGGSTGKYREAWLSSLIAAGGMDVNVCQCEEVTRRELLNVAVPKYLQWSSERMGDRIIGELWAEGPVDLDRLKRLTRAGMGHCQGRRCREEVALLVAQAAKEDVSKIPIATFRPPVRPLPLKVMWPQDEPEEVRKSWYYWIKIPPKTIEELLQRREQA